jgi:hypothetical protein
MYSSTSAVRYKFESAGSSPTNQLWALDIRPEVGVLIFSRPYAENPSSCIGGGSFALTNAAS